MLLESVVLAKRFMDKFEIILYFRTNETVFTWNRVFSLNNDTKRVYCQTTSVEIEKKKKDLPRVALTQNSVLPMTQLNFLESQTSRLVCLMLNS